MAPSDYYSLLLLEVLSLSGMMWGGGKRGIGIREYIAVEYILTVKMLGQSVPKFSFSELPNSKYSKVAIQS